MMKMRAASSTIETTKSQELSSLESGRGVDGEEQLQASPSAKLKLRGKDDVIRLYERTLLTAEGYARVVGFLYAASQFIGYCNLTFATVVLLGGFCSVLHPSDFWSVSGLLLAEAARLASATFFSIFRDRFVHLLFSPNSPMGVFLWARAFSFLAQSSINFVVVFVVIKRIQNLHSYSLVDTARNLPPALLLFYRLLVANSVLNLITIGTDNISSFIFFLYIWRRRGGHISFIRYYEYVLTKFLRGTLGLADPVDFFHFAYVDLLSREFRLNVEPELVVWRYAKTLEYLQAHRQGFDHLFVYLKYGDPSVQEAAANVPGLWMLQPTTRGMEWLPDGLVTRLIRRLPDGEVGGAAAYSLGNIAAYGKGYLLLSLGTRVGDALAAAFDPTPSHCLMLLRAMVFLVHGQVEGLSSPPMRSPEEDPVLSKIFSLDRRQQLERNLETLIRSRDAEVVDDDTLRPSALAAYLLVLLGLNPSDLGITPLSDGYWLSTEQLVDLRISEFYQLKAPQWARTASFQLTVPKWARAVS